MHYRQVPKSTGAFAHVLVKVDRMSKSARPVEAKARLRRAAVELQTLASNKQG